MKVVGRPPPARLVVPVEVCWFDIYAGAYQLNGANLMLGPLPLGRRRRPRARPPTVTTVTAPAAIVDFPRRSS